jgi:hypothetical protein
MTTLAFSYQTLESLSPQLWTLNLWGLKILLMLVLTSIIPATQEAETGRTAAQGQPDN